ncbi:MAG TPA: ACP S-malonyltransferase [Thermoflexales bacterium]|nr:ACP S-malonyltransferase [Thermoflexales bacterium]HQW36220.1 ACP S-malonyltransferase [Thermoflexales bacterium]HQZ22449.1 ACP S-malonyltransferase [Thermoflexales bacterium]HQZ99138.1 ACP S-malonyltransferase [Thermoflexales bacterium]
MSTAYVFPGQGSQFVGMGAESARVRPILRGTFERADAALGFALSRLCWEGPEAELNDTLNTQPALFAHSLGAFYMAQMSGELPAPDFVAGHSLGEFSALCAAGALAFEDGVKLVRERGRLMKLAGERAPGGMAAVLGLQPDALREVCAEVSAQHNPGVVVANDNCPGQIVISGGKEAVAAASAIAKTKGAKRVLPLAVSIASHSPLMHSIADEFAAAVKNTPLVTATIPVIGNTTARPITHPDDIRAELNAQLTSPVRWTETVQWLGAQGVTQFVELGPKDVLCNLIKRTLTDPQTLAIS